jgi:hypothetical protein
LPVRAAQRPPLDPLLAPVVPELALPFGAGLFFDLSFEPFFQSALFFWIIFAPLFTELLP